jgi:putative Ca2+/H+ antiporter (TMEM165/GDT1 family)
VLNRIKNIFFYIFILIFTAELGDKTQIAGFSLTAQSGSLFPVIIGASLALILSTFLAVLIGNKLASFVPQRVVKIVAALLFIGTGVFLFVSSLVK